MKKLKLRVGFDARMIAYRQAGIGQYNLNLLRELAHLQLERGDFELLVYQSRKEPRPPSEWLEFPKPVATKIEKRVLWTPPHHRWEQLALPLELFPAGPDVFHSPDFIPPFRRWAWHHVLPRPFASVITIHDLAFLRFPHLLTEESARYYGQVRRAALSAQLVIAVSESTALDVVEQLGLSREKVRVVYEAANPLYRPLSVAEVADLEKAAAKGVAKKLEQAGLTPQNSFLLFVSTIEPRKNLPTLLKAYCGMLDRVPEGESRPKLVLAGREGWLYQDIYKLADELNLKEKLVWLGGVSSEELLYLYNRAALLAMPSLYEGFGLPPLEALACGCPAVVADTSSLPEVAGPVGQKLPPEEIPAWTAALLDGWQNRATNRATTLEEGPKWASTFSWRRAAEETLKVYQEAGPG